MAVSRHVGADSQTALLGEQPMLRERSYLSSPVYPSEMRSCCVAQTGLEHTELLSALSCLLNVVRDEPTLARGPVLH